MTNFRQLKIDLLKDQNNASKTISQILSVLSQVDEASALLPIEKALASRTLIKKLWDFLPDEQDSHQFESVEAQTTDGINLLPTTDLQQNVTLHLGWDVLAFSCSLNAAWHAWTNFNTLNTDTFNCCIYPANLQWYIVRAGANLYPMHFINDTYCLNTERSSL